MMSWRSNLGLRQSGGGEAFGIHVTSYKYPSSLHNDLQGAKKEANIYYDKVT